MCSSILTRSALRRSFAVFVIFSLASIAVPSPSKAESFFDLYGGGVFGQSTQIDHQFFGDPTVFPRPAPMSVTKHSGFSASWTVGGRVGYWFEPLPWLGAAMDISYFEQKGSDTEIDLIPMSFLVMLRYPMMTSESFPKGRLQPYIGVGPSVYYSHTSINFDPPLQNVNHGSLFGDVGLDLRIGTLWRISTTLGMFTEYRFTHVTLDYERTACVPRSLAEALSLVCVFANDNRPEVTVSTTQTTLDSHHILVGVRF